MKAIIGGTGVYDIGESHNRLVHTKYGEVELDLINIDGEEIVFLSRHGKNHTTPPHRINYRANMMALKEIGVEYIYATAAVGSCNENYAPGDVVIIKDFLDFTKSRPITFFEGGEEKVKHVDMSNPYCKNLRDKFYLMAKEEGIEIKGEAVYVCTEGPRFETASEINMFKHLGGDVVGMTNVPEVVLAKELGICYATIGIISNWCAGMKGDITIHDIQSALQNNKEKITRAFINVFKGELDKNNCNCKNSIIEL
ncbi:S-methyl-5'-thioinosine phosphorylase [Clostridium sp. Cult2]|uniref:S-methyl-5'-thioinosine phosphorylase n=1 Tax=Clostridium sp. Cult2 TaxID=2079003 RepID=UPI001F394A5D|nr:S-methyl-5'-thioinosine phosphorylase [Clostridium sp. Cult2]MCF6464742.1 S-methyl-5'-thioinosine phosphorylase [Clostridium sp. Cult2]